jgi:hypothetical protein
MNLYYVTMTKTFLWVKNDVEQMSIGETQN